MSLMKDIFLEINKQVIIILYNKSHSLLLDLERTVKLLKAMVRLIDWTTTFFGSDTLSTPEFKNLLFFYLIKKP